MAVPDLSDDELAARGDHEAIQVLYYRHAPALLAFLTARGRGYDPEDVHQETWLRVSQNLGQRFQGGNFRAWLFAIARNLLTDRVRRARPIPLDREVAQQRTDPLQTLLDEERRQILSDCLAQLAREDPRAGDLARGRLGGEPYEQLAGRLGLQPAQAHRLWHTCVKKLQACVGRTDR